MHFTILGERKDIIDWSLLFIQLKCRLIHHFMKTIYALLILLLVMSCSKPSSIETTFNEASSDTSLLRDTSDYLPDEIEEEYEPEEVNEIEEEYESEEANEISEEGVESRYEKVSQKIMEGVESFYQVTITTNGYEAMSDLTWYFDKKFSVRYFKESWSMEGQDGTTEFFLVDDSVVCVFEEESGGMGTTTIRVCEEIGGKETTGNYGETPVDESLPASYLNTKRKVIDDYLGELLSLLGGNEITETGEETYTIKIENTIDVGQEETATETTTVTIPKMLYEKLLN